MFFSSCVVWKMKLIGTNLSVIYGVLKNFMKFLKGFKIRHGTLFETIYKLIVFNFNKILLVKHNFY